MLYIYLDTSFLSQLTKATKKSPEVFVYKEKWTNLLNLLRQGVKNSISLCPASQFQTQEAMLAEGLIKEFVSLQLELSKGYYFRKFEEILVHQVANKALLYLGRQQDIDSGWSVLTRKTPPVKDPLTATIYKSSMVQDAELARVLRKKFNRKLSYNEYYKVEKQAFIQQTFLNPNSHWPEMLIVEAKIKEEEVQELFNFLDKYSFGPVPFINIFCSLWASTIFHEQNRKYKEGDLYDVVALACAVPYCRIITTDTNMKSFIKRLRINEKYEINVYAPIEDDLNALEKLLSELVSR